MAASTKSKKRARRRLVRQPSSKSEFIRTRPPGMTAKEVMAAGAELGVTMSEHFVYNIRSTAKKKASRLAPSLSASATRAITGRAATREAEFRTLTLALGLDRSKRLLAEVETELAAVSSGR
jgi:hypothetical protein